MAVEVGAQDPVRVRPVCEIPRCDADSEDILAAANRPPAAGRPERQAQAGLVVPAEDLANILAELDACVVAAPIRGDVLLEDGDVDALALQLQAGNQPAQGAADLCGFR